MKKIQVKVRLDEKAFTALVKGEIVKAKNDFTEVQVILADIGYEKMLDILENALDDLSKTDGSINWKEKMKYLVRTHLNARKIDLSEITDEDIIEVGKIIGWELTETVPLFIVKQKVGTFLSVSIEDKGFSYHPQEAFRAYQYLQSRGYKLPKYY